MYTHVWVKTQVTGEFDDAGISVDSLWIKGTIPFALPIPTSLKRIVLCYFGNTEAEVLKIGIPEQREVAPQAIFAHVCDLHGRYLSPENR